MPLEQGRPPRRRTPDSDMSDIATISVITSGVVGVVGGLGGPGLTAWFTDRREKRTTQDARFDELRTVLDDASVALVGVWEAMPSPEQVKDRVVYGERLGGSRLALHKVWQQEGRIAARVGTSDPLYLTYHAAHVVAGELYRWHIQLYDAGPSGVVPGQIDKILADMPITQGAFFTETAKRIGPERKVNKDGT